MQMVLDALRVVMEPAKPGCEVSEGRHAVLVEAVLMFVQWVLDKFISRLWPEQFP